jgi:Zn-dependent metalloprotease
MRKNLGVSDTEVKSAKKYLNFLEYAGIIVSRKEFNMCDSKRRNPLFCVVPPHILIEIARNGSPQDRDIALTNLEFDHSNRSHRAAFQLLGGLRVPEVRQQDLDETALPVKYRTIYDCKHGSNLPGTVVRTEGQPPVTDSSVNHAYDGLGHTFDFYLASYHRNSIDNKGLPLIASVHYSSKYNNAFWNGHQMVFGDGDGVYFNDFTVPLDVIGHELTHGVTGSEANLLYQGQSGALNESISDVFGSLVKQYVLQQTADKADWLIGAGLFTSKVKGTALRSMKAPGTAYNDPVLGKDPQPADMAHYVNTTSDNGGVHINSGIPNRAFYLTATKIGGYAWQKAGQIWYDTLLDHNLKQSSNFAAFADLTIRHATVLFGSKSTERQAVADAWQQVGVKTATTKLTLDAAA